eukprot:TRINITY_DN2215_c0_g1_i2.p1 TRINITY_DN2215_c0_g1~~TRINITY_DN2215_c0_g1_i2.p1  ORF type:complete len:455 (-),score=96.22 TRINITY_DN2215_c0_g1_i2:1953-3317(-)
MESYCPANSPSSSSNSNSQQILSVPSSLLPVIDPMQQPSGGVTPIPPHNSSRHPQTPQTPRVQFFPPSSCNSSSSSSPSLILNNHNSHQQVTANTLNNNNLTNNNYLAGPYTTDGLLWPILPPIMPSHLPPGDIYYNKSPLNINNTLLCPNILYSPTPERQNLDAGKLGSIPLSGLSTLNGLAGFTNGAINPAALAALANQQQQQNRTPPATAAASQQQTHEMTVPNELIGCIIGKGGSKIAEIRQLSGAMIRISNCEEREGGNNMDRTITITGNAESVALAQYLINMSMDLQKANLLEAQTKAFPNASPLPSTTSATTLLNPLFSPPSYFLAAAAAAPHLKPDLHNHVQHAHHALSCQSIPLGLDGSFSGASLTSRNLSSASSSASSTNSSSNNNNNGGNGTTYQVIPKLKSPSCNNSHQQIAGGSAAVAGILSALTQNGGAIRIRSDKFTPY